MSMPYGLGLSRGEDSSDLALVTEFVRTIPNAGITELIDGKVYDLWLGEDGQVHQELTDGGGGEVYELTGQLLRTGGGSIAYETASYFELGQCLLVEELGAKLRAQGAPRTGPLPGTRFHAWRCLDLGQTLAEVRGTIEDPEAPPIVRDDARLLARTLGKAMSWHMLVVFGE